MNSNSDLIFEKDIIQDKLNERMVHTILLQTDYGLNDHFSFSVVVPYLFQKEKVNLLESDYSITNDGPGDISIWSNYKNKFGKHDLLVGVALKMPNGSTDNVDPNSGIQYPFSFQNGSGSWDFIFNIYDEIPLDKRQMFRWINQISGKINTKGNEFDAHPGYKFGHTFQYFSAISVHWVMGKYLASSFAGVSYQYKMKDEFNGGFENENTGGNWIYASLGYNHQFSPKLMVGISGSMPVYRSVNGLQLTTDKQANITIGYIL